jgi:hypothetical protein
MKAVSEGRPRYLAEAPGGNDQGVAGVFAAVALERERALAEIHRVDVVKDDLGLEALGVLQKALHQLGALHAVHVGRPVVDLGRGHELPALGDAGDQHRIEVGACRIHGSGVAGGAGAEDQDFGVFGVGHGKYLCGKRHSSVYSLGPL